MDYVNLCLNCGGIKDPVFLRVTGPHFRPLKNRVVPSPWAKLGNSISWCTLENWAGNHSLRAGLTVFVLMRWIVVCLFGSGRHAHTDTYFQSPFLSLIAPAHTSPSKAFFFHAFCLFLLFSLQLSSAPSPSASSPTPRLTLSVITAIHLCTCSLVVV